MSTEPAEHRADDAASAVEPAPDAGAIAVVEAPRDTSIHPVSGDPRRPWSIWVAVVAAYLGVATVVAGVLVAFYRSKDVDLFAGAAWLNGVVETEPGSLIRIAMVTGLFAVTLLVSAGAIIAGYYAWQGYGWTRVAALVAVGVSLLSLLGNLWMALSILPIAAAAGAIWLPASRAFFAAWHARRHPVPPPPPAERSIFYGPLPRYLA
ncbi:hypothetical protein G7070_10750 [Propioniciclava coleopterorum]|uniref:Uncharacterized protein n=1 Tax=Propioniciclava coleopterorum TaxID=2714937 RepID=A0A6G7Y7H0_9ACTN|nr:hypothetical protein [Propioniciclava coleopterorum]QIK72659.1 hypothetical protein G7070_10750 [Propioniciclava coleopterorum]